MAAPLLHFWKKFFKFNNRFCLRVDLSYELIILVKRPEVFVNI